MTAAEIVKVLGGECCLIFLRPFSPSTLLFSMNNSTKFVVEKDCFSTTCETKIYVLPYNVVMAPVTL